MMGKRLSGMTAACPSRIFDKIRYIRKPPSASYDRPSALSVVCREGNDAES